MNKAMSRMGWCAYGKIFVEISNESIVMV